jgi:hypothetical protein
VLKPEACFVSPGALQARIVPRLVDPDIVGRSMVPGDTRKNVEIARQLTWL